MIKNQIRYINKKTLDCRISNRSTNFIAPDFITGCAYKCAYCVEKGTLISTPNGKIPIEDQDILLNRYRLQENDNLFIVSHGVFISILKAVIENKTIKEILKDRWLGNCETYTTTIEI